MAESQTSEIWCVQILDVLFMRGADVGWSPPEQSPGCQAGIDRLTNYRPKLGRRPPVYRPGFAKLPLVYWRAPGDFWSLVFEGHRPSPVQNVTWYISSKNYARLRGKSWNLAMFGRSTILAGDRWICDVGITYLRKKILNFLWVLMLMAIEKTVECYFISLTCKSL